jgi:uncharacterized protein YbjT (DUF2867 family)
LVKRSPRLFCKQGIKRGSGRVTSTRPRCCFPGVEIVPLDVAQPATLAPALHGITAVFAALPYELQPAADQALIAASAEAGVTRFVKLSAMGADADPSSPHMLAENSLAESGLEWTVLRPNFFMQNYATMMADQVRSGAIYEPAAEGATSFVDARDIAAVALAALTQPGHNRQIYALTGPVALTRAEVAATLTRVVGKKVTYIAIDDAALRNGMAGAPASLVATHERALWLCPAGLYRNFDARRDQGNGKARARFCQLRR